MVMSPLSVFCRAATRNLNEPLNILTFPTHERYQINMANTGHNFFLIRANGVKDWNFDYGLLPSNYQLLVPAKGDNQVPAYIDYDVVLSQTKVVQFDIAQRISQQYNIPHICIEHTLPHPQWPQHYLIQNKQRKGHINAFISNYSRKQWLYEEDEAVVVEHGIDTELFKPGDVERQPHVLSVVNDWIQREWCCGFTLWREVTQDLPVRPIGDTKGLSKPAPSIQALVNEYQTSQIFINTSTVSPVPTALLEAMSCGCAVVSTQNCMIPEIIEHGKNGYMTNDPLQMRMYLDNLLRNPDKCRELGQMARKTIETRFGLARFTSAWDKLLRQGASLI